MTKQQRINELQTMIGDMRLNMEDSQWRMKQSDTALKSLLSTLVKVMYPQSPSITLSQEEIIGKVARLAESYINKDRYENDTINHLKSENSKLWYLIRVAMKDENLAMEAVENNFKSTNF